MWPIMAAILALHVLFSTVATKFRLSLPVLLALLATSQLALHQVFDLFSHGAHVSTSGLNSMATMAHHSMSAEAHSADMLATAMNMSDHGMGAAGQGAELVAHTGSMSTWMMLAHVAATLAAAGLLAYGENALWTLAHWLRPLWRGPAVVLELPAQLARIRTTARPLIYRPWRNLRPDTRRGPPRLSALFA